MNQRKRHVIDIIRAIKSEHLKTRANAVMELSMLPLQEAQEAVPDLIQMLADTKGVLRAQVAYVLGQMRIEKAVVPLIEALRTAEQTDRGIILLSIGAIGDRSVVDDILPFLKNGDWRTRVSAALALAELGDERGVNALATMTNDTSLPCEEREAIQRDLKRLSCFRLVRETLFPNRQ